MNRVFIFSWNRRESNPGPNKEPICFLHAYLFFNCRVPTDEKKPICTLGSVISLMFRNITQAISTRLVLHMLQIAEKNLLRNSLEQDLVLFYA